MTPLRRSPPMPIHDWTRVSAGTWHDFHLVWVAQLQLAFNDGLLPADYYSLAEWSVGPKGPVELPLQTIELPDDVAYHTADMEDYVLKRRTIVVRHNSGDRIVALIEIVSPGNKGSKRALDTFV